MQVVDGEIGIEGSTCSVDVWPMCRVTCCGAVIVLLTLWLFWDIGYVAGCSFSAGI
jgi:hypothetical protein